MATCFKCGCEFRQVFKDGRLQDLDQGTDLPHWQTCKARSSNRKPQQVRLQLTEQSTHRAAKEITGPEYRESCGNCPALPWNPCPCYPEAA